MKFRLLIPFALSCSLAAGGIVQAADTTKPVIAKVGSGSITSDGFNLMIDVTDDTAVDHIKIASWSVANDKDDLVEAVLKAGGTAPVKEASFNYHVSPADHNGEAGDYKIEIVAYDTSGNASNTTTLSAKIPEVPITYNITLATKDVTSTGYTAVCTLNTDKNVGCIKFPTWTDANGDDDIQPNWETTSIADGIKDGLTWTYEVKTADHNNETGTYVTAAHVYDVNGKELLSSLKTVNVPASGSSNTVSAKAAVANITATGYDIICTVSDDALLSTVKFPTWTDANGQDDIQPEWETTTIAEGIKDGLSWTYHVDIAAHNNEAGDYKTDILIYDKKGNIVSKIPLTVTVPGNGTQPNPLTASGSIPEITSDGYKITCTVSDPSRVSCVKFPTWTEYNGEDDIQPDWEITDIATGISEGDTWTYYVDIKDHNSESGMYHTNVCVYDLENKLVFNKILDAKVPEKQEPAESLKCAFAIKDMSPEGYTITCTPSDPSRVSCVKFPVYTERDGDDDVQPDWETSASADGIRDGDVWYYYVKTADHNNEYGNYVNGIFVYNQDGEVIFKEKKVIEVPESGSSQLAIDVKVAETNVTKEGYDVICIVSSRPEAPEKLVFRTYSEQNGAANVKEDILTSYTEGEDADTTIWNYHVSTADFNSKSGDYYTEVVVYGRDEKTLKTLQLKATVPASSDTPSTTKIIGHISDTENLVRFGYIYAPNGTAAELTHDTPGRTEVVFTEYDASKNFTLDVKALKGYTVRVFVTYLLGGDEVTAYTDPTIL